MSRPKNKIRRKTVSVTISEDLYDLYKSRRGIENLSKYVERQLEQLLKTGGIITPQKAWETTIQTTLVNLMEVIGEQPFRHYFNEVQELTSEAIIITQLKERYNLPITPHELSAIMHQSFRGMAHG